MVVHRFLPLDAGVARHYQSLIRVCRQDARPALHEPQPQPQPQPQSQPQPEPAIGRGDESLMSPKAHGTTETPPQANLKYNCDPATADKICCFNHHYAEHSGYFQSTSWLAEVDQTAVTTYYDSVSGRPLFRAPIGRTFDEFLKESMARNGRQSATTRFTCKR